MRMDTNLRACDADEKLRGTEIGHETGVQTIGKNAEACSLRACMHDETERVLSLTDRTQRLLPTVGHRVVGVASTTPKRPYIIGRVDVLLTLAERTENDRRSLL